MLREVVTHAREETGAWRPLWLSEEALGGELLRKILQQGLKPLLRFAALPLKQPKLFQPSSL